MQITKFIPASREDVFDAFTDRDKLEQWCAPEGMTLKLPEFEAREGGRYHYVHTNKDGEFNCVGYFKEIIPNEKLVSVDEKAYGPDGKTLFENVTCSVSFRDKTGGTELTVTQRGFTDAKMDQECEQGWADCLNKLTEVLRKDSSGPRADTEYSATL